MNDYINIILTVHDTPQAELWGEKENKEIKEKPRIGLISVDIQRIFDPQRPLNSKLFESHLTSCQQLMESRIEDILKGIGFGKES